MCPGLFSEKNEAEETDEYMLEECDEQGVLDLLGEVNGRREVRLTGDLTEDIMEKFEEALKDED